MNKDYYSPNARQNSRRNGLANPKEVQVEPHVFDVPPVPGILMDVLATTLRVLLPVVYGGLTFYFARTFFRSLNQAKRLQYAVSAAYAVLGLHVIYIGAYAAQNHHDLVATVYELFSLIAFTLLAVYVFAELRPSRETSGTGFFVTAICFLLQLVSSLTIGGEPVPETKAILSDPVFNLHVTTSVFGYAALMLAAIYGSLYLLLYREIRRNQFGAIFEHIPSLDRLERYGLRATAFGFIFLTFAIIFGGMLLVGPYRADYGPNTGWNLFLDPKVLTTLLVWLVFGVTLLVRKVVHLEGRRLVLFWMSGFALTVISMTVVNWVGTSFHSFL